MRCSNPYTNKQGQAFPCRQCLPCRFNRRREWTHRIILESALHADNCFLTLTYASEHLATLPNGLATLVPPDAQAFLKRFRMSIAPLRIRYFLVGEYGDDRGRPHFHLAIFGYPRCLNYHQWIARGRPKTGVTKYDPSTGRFACCEVCRVVHEAWGLGRVDLANLEHDSAQYVAGYTVKKMVAHDDERLFGRHPEFARMSLKPGLGAGAAQAIVESFRKNGGEGDVPSSLAHGRKSLPLGRYLKIKMRKAEGGDGKAPQEVLDELSKELLPLRIAARSSTENPSLKRQIVEANKGKVASLIARNEIHKKRSKI